MYFGNLTNIFYSGGVDYIASEFMDDFLRMEMNGTSYRDPECLNHKVPYSPKTYV